MRICSLLPSATEIVCALGLEDSLVAVTHECDYPPAVKQVPAVTAGVFDHRTSSSSEIHRHISESVHCGSSIYALDQDRLQKLSPDLILTQELCDVCAVAYPLVKEAVRVLRGDFTVVSLEPTSLEEILLTIMTVGELTGRRVEAMRLVDQLRVRIEAVRSGTASIKVRPRRVLALEWLDPFFAGGHWVPEMIRLAGSHDGLGREGKPSAVITAHAIARYDPEVLILMPCGFGLDKTVELWDETPGEFWRKTTAFARNQVYAVDGSSFFNRPGPRVVRGLEILAQILHPEQFFVDETKAEWKPLRPNH